METQLRQQMLEVSRELVRLGLNRGTSGNVGVRCGEHFLVTPSGVPADEMSASDMVKMDFAGNVIGSGKPSSEWRFHLDILKARSDVNAVVHVHSIFATTMACLRMEIPAFHYMISVAGGDSIRCAPYALFGSQELSDVAVTALENRKACLLANHGMIAVGESLKKVLSITVEVETLCEQYWRALQIGQPFILSADEMQEVQEKFKGYGRWNQS
jgi:L-fuculose-phosphate aldolase